MHGIRSETPRNRVGAHEFGLERKRYAVLQQAPCRVLGGEQAPHAPRRVFQRRLHRVPAVENRTAIAWLSRRRNTLCAMALDVARQMGTLWRATTHESSRPCPHSFAPQPQYYGIG